MKKVLLITAGDVIGGSVIEDNVDVKLLSKAIGITQETDLKPILGAQLYNDVIDAVYNLSVSGSAMSDVYASLIDAAKPYLINKTVAEFIVINQYKFSNKGLMKLNDNSATSISDGDLKTVKELYDNKANYFKIQLIDFLKANGLINSQSETQVTSDASGWYFGKGSSCGTSSISSSDVIKYSGDWLLSGNAGTNPSFNYLGTSDDKDFIIKRNAVPQIKIEASSMFLGANAGTNNRSVIDSLALGYNALSHNGNVSNVIAIGKDAGLANMKSNVILLGSGATATTTNQLSISPVITSLRIPGLSTGGTGYVLTDVVGNGILSLQPSTGGGDVEFTAIGNTSNASGATVSGSVITLQPASENFGGLVTTEEQTFEGFKTFNQGLRAGTTTVGLNNIDVDNIIVNENLDIPNGFLIIGPNTGPSGTTTISAGQIQVDQLIVQALLQASFVTTTGLRVYDELTVDGLVYAKANLLVDGLIQSNNDIYSTGTISASDAILAGDVKINSGNLLLGTSSTSAKIHVASSTANLWLMGSNYSQMVFGQNTGNYAEFYRPTSGKFSIENAGKDITISNGSGTYSGAEGLVIQAVTHNVGIGTNTPTYKLQVQTSGGSGFRVQGAGSSLSVPLLNFYDTSTSVDGVLTSNGAAFAIGTYSNHPVHICTNHNGSPVAIFSTSNTVGIGGTPDDSALLDLNSTTKGLLLPRMTKAQRNAISATAGLAIFQTDNTPGLRVYNGTNWIKYSETTD